MPIPSSTPEPNERAEALELEGWLRAAAEGDEEAWRRIVGRFAPRVYGVVRAQCGDPDLAEEIAQSTFCTVAAKIGAYVEEGRFEAWIFRIALNRLRDEERRRRRHARPTDDVVLGTIPGPEGGAAAGRPGAGSTEGRDPVAAREQIAALRGAVDRLSPADRRVVHLRHSGGLSFRQIADALEEPLGTVLARHHRALRKLKEFLGGAE